MVASTLAASLAFGVAGCGPDGPDSVGGIAVDVDDASLRQGDSIQLTVTEFEFSPDEIVAEPGRYTGDLVNQGALLHNFTLVDGTTFAVPPGETVAIDVVVPDGGLTYVCSVEGHEAAGMRGRIDTPETHSDT